MKKYTTIFHTCIKFERHVLYPRYVNYPNNTKEGKTNMYEFNIDGLDGDVDSMDACHVLIDFFLTDSNKIISVENQN